MNKTRKILSGVRNKILEGLTSYRLRKNRNLRIIIGAAKTRIPGWLPTNRQNLDLLKPEEWSAQLQGNPIHAILAEHVWEHLTLAEAHTAAQTCYQFLVKDGYARIAVPDGLFPDPDYIAAVRPGGHGAGSDDHKVLYTYKTLSEVFSSAGFEVKLLEFFDEEGNFHEQKWSPEDGMIFRSKNHDARNSGGKIKYTSIILDAWKKNP